MLASMLAAHSLAARRPYHPRHPRQALLARPQHRRQLPHLPALLPRADAGGARRLAGVDARQHFGAGHPEPGFGLVLTIDGANLRRVLRADNDGNALGAAQLTASYSISLPAETGAGFRIAAIPHEVVRAFSKRRQAIEEAARAHGYRTPKGMELATLRTRRTKRETKLDGFFKTWQVEARALGFELNCDHHQTRQLAPAYSERSRSAPTPDRFNTPSLARSASAPTTVATLSKPQHNSVINSAMSFDPSIRPPACPASRSDSAARIAIGSGNEDGIRWRRSYSRCEYEARLGKLLSGNCFCRCASPPVSNCQTIRSSASSSPFFHQAGRRGHRPIGGAGYRSRFDVCLPALAARLVADSSAPLLCVIPR
jgi:TrwC relaxase